MEKRAEEYNRCREELFQLEREGKVLVIAPNNTLGVKRIERDTEKLQLLWGEGYQMAVQRMEEVRAFWGK
jgi:predicted patatin/cPLA2 family phospholipase